VIRPFLIVFILILIGFEILILFPKQTDRPTEAVSQAPDSQIPTLKNQIQQKGEGIHIVESPSGTRDWELFSKVAQSYQNSSVWDLENVKLIFYNNEKQSIILKGKKGSIDTKSKDMKIDGEVEIETTNGYIFTAPYVEYNSAERLIFCTGSVAVKGPFVQKKRSLFLKAIGMRIPVSSEKMYLDHSVTGQKIFADDKKLDLKSDRAELSSINQIAQFMDSVVILYPPMTMTSDQATFAYSEKSQMSEYLDLTGKVELRDENRRAVSEKLRVDFSMKQLVFSGHPRLYQDEDELTGDQIIFIDNGRKVKVEKVKLNSKEGL
jgi:LPS export ABC transporter protein LptC/lipopolysaccharide transport protein LptA